MKRSEFLKRLGLGAVAAVAAPALLAKEEKAIELPKDECLADVGKVDSLAFWRQSDTVMLSTGMVYFITEDDKMIGPHELKASASDCPRDCEYCEGPACRKSSSIRIYK